MFAIMALAAPSSTWRSTPQVQAEKFINKHKTSMRHVNRAQLIQI